MRLHVLLGASRNGMQGVIMVRVSIRVFSVMPENMDGCLATSHHLWWLFERVHPYGQFPVFSSEGNVQRAAPDLGIFELGQCLVEKGSSRIHVVQDMPNVVYLGDKLSSEFFDS